MVLQRYGLVLAGLLIFSLVLVAPVSSAVVTIDPTTPGGIAGAITAAGHDDTIILNTGTYFSNGISSSGKNITLRANTSFGGNPANTIIDAGLSDRFIYMTDSHSLTIDNLTLQNGVTTGGGGMIASNGPLTISSSTIFNSTAAGDGGAIWSNPGTVTITSSTISNSSVTGYNVGGTGRYSVGGAIFNNFGTYTITSSTISNSSAAGTGGAIYSNHGTVTLTSSTITDCSAVFGGAIYNANGSTLTISSSTISDCTATNSGGAITNYGDFVTITSSIITNCSANSGGAIYNYQGIVTIQSSSTISDCSATGEGGAIENYEGTLYITSSIISGCSAGNEGGAIYNYGDVIITSSTISDCMATNTGGAITNYEGTVTIQSSSTISGCSAEYGGAIYNSDGSTTHTTTLNITSSTISDCSATQEGGAIANYGTYAIVNITSSTLSGCSATNGGAIYNNGTLTITSSTITECTVTSYGGAIFNNGTLTITSSTISNCSAGFSGAIYNNSTLTLTSSIISNCTASWGGAIINNGTLDITSSTILDCSATSGSGGAIYNFSGGIVTIHFSRIYHCDTGTAVVLDDGTINAENNWWGSNAEPSGSVSGAVTYTPWLMLGITASPSSITTAQTSAIRTNMTFNSTGHDTSALGHLPNGITNLFALDSGSGSVSPLTSGTFSGVAGTRFTPASSGVTVINATVDDQSVYLTLPVSQATLSPTLDRINGGDDAPVTTTVPVTPTQAPPGSLEVNVGGNSAVNRVVVTGTGIAGLIVTGTVQPVPGTNLTAPPGTVFQYISLVPARFTTITNAVIHFSVPQSWLDENHIAPGSIILYHQTATGWEALPTTVLYTKDGSVFFSAQSGSFSLFAIAGTPGSAVPGTVSVPPEVLSSAVQEQAPVPAATIRTPVTTQTTAPPVTASQPSAPSPLLNIVLIIAAIGVLGAGGFLARRWWIQRQNPALFKEYD